MAKQKVVLRLSMEDDKKRAKAMQCAVGLHGVMSVSHDKDNMTVTGEGIDSVALTRLLRKKKMGYVELVMVTTVDEKKDKEKEVKEKPEVNNNIQPIILPNYYGQYALPPYYYVDVREPNCSIM